MSSIKDFYKDRTILVTGGTGFMGKVLLVKLVRSLPGIKRIYVLLRSKKGMEPSKRVQVLISTPPFTFEGIDQENLKKIVAISGDTSEDDLGLSKENRKKLIEEVSIVFHLAASVNMNLSLKAAIEQNTLGTYRLLKLCSEFKRLVSFAHLSTAFCNIEILTMDEKIYHPNVDPYKIMDIVQWMDEKWLERIEKDIMDVHPNSYTFSKRLAECVAWEMGKVLPVAIGRPSIVLPALKEPAPGWIDSYNGPAGLCVAAGKGILRSGLLDKNCKPEVVPVDIAINGLIICGYIRAVNKFTETPVYNITQAKILIATWGEVFDKLLKYAYDYPFKIFLWYPVFHTTKNLWVHNTNVFFTQMIPAYFLDFLLPLLNRKPFLVNIQNRLNTGMKLISYFASRDWEIAHDKLIKIGQSLPEEDQKEFYLFEGFSQIDEYLKVIYFGSRKHLMKEDWHDLRWPRIIHKIMFCLEHLGRLLLLYLVVKLLLYVFGGFYLLWMKYEITSTKLF